ncbi:MAG: hypothetical protein B6244_13875 [Candidatus Cloacimonetes bacterium 4572_55]|nr:MAG: hypothetical protein B6244_13875 [Candidatus Cloacimonetes bacterium 4572_55]
MPFRKVKGEAPYQALAFIYNHMMSHVNYADWVAYLQKVFEKFRHSPKNVLETACGVGTFTSYLEENGYHIHAIDQSEMMIQVARQTNISSNTTFQIGDIRTFESERKFDTILCLYDSMNYLSTKEDLSQALAAMSAVMEPRGLFVFDVTTVHNSLNLYDNTEAIEETAEFLYWRRSRYLRRDRIQINEFTIFLKDGEIYRRFYEKHKQWIFSYHAVRSAIKSAGLKLVGRFHEFTLDPPEKSSLRVHYVVQKPLYLEKTPRNV